MKKIFFLLLLLSACSSNELENNLVNDFIFSEKMNFNEFKMKLENYADQSSYSNIDN